MCYLLLAGLSRGGVLAGYCPSVSKQSYTNSLNQRGCSDPGVEFTFEISVIAPQGYTQQVTLKVPLTMIANHFLAANKTTDLAASK